MEKTGVMNQATEPLRQWIMNFQQPKHRDRLQLKWWIIVHDKSNRFSDLSYLRYRWPSSLDQITHLGCTPQPSECLSALWYWASSSRGLIGFGVSRRKRHQIWTLSLWSANESTSDPLSLICSSLRILRFAPSLTWVSHRQAMCLTWGHLDIHCPFCECPSPVWNSTGRNWLAIRTRSSSTEFKIQKSETEQRSCTSSIRLPLNSAFSVHTYDW